MMKPYTKKLILIVGSLRTTTTTLSTTTGSELECTAQARPVNFVVVAPRTKMLVVEKPVPARRIKLEQTSKALKGYTQSFEVKI